MPFFCGQYLADCGYNSHPSPKLGGQKARRVALNLTLVFLVQCLSRGNLAAGAPVCPPNYRFGADHANFHRNLPTLRVEVGTTLYRQRSPDRCPQDRQLSAEVGCRFEPEQLVPERTVALPLQVLRRHSILTSRLRARSDNFQCARFFRFEPPSTGGRALAPKLRAKHRHE